MGWWGGGELVGGEDPAFGLGGTGAVDAAGGEGGGRCGEGRGRGGKVARMRGWGVERWYWRRRVRGREYGRRGRR